MIQQGIRILLVDDEPNIRRTLRLLLLNSGFEVAEASRGEEALHQLRDETFDVVLLDINMPGIGGIETLRRLRVFAPSLPVLMVTVRNGKEERRQAFELGANDYVTKPFSMPRLIERIRAAVYQVQVPVCSGSASMA